MKKIFLMSIMLLGVIVTYSNAKDIYLPSPNRAGGVPLMQALNERKSVRSFSPQKIDEETLSNTLWSAVGVNKEDNKRTIPTALNKQNLDIYVLSEEGAFLYDALSHSLIKITDNDIRQKKDAPITLAYAIDKSKLNKDLYSAMHVGSSYQNVGLYCASFGLGNVVRGSFDKEKLEEDLKLPENIEIFVTQAIGYPQN